MIIHCTTTTNSSNSITGTTAAMIVTLLVMTTFTTGLVVCDVVVQEPVLVMVTAVFLVMVGEINVKVPSLSAAIEGLSSCTW